jgi:uncharacterized protein (DUF924 family)
MTPEDVLRFWFVELKPAQWFKTDAALDAEIKHRFEPLLSALTRRVPPEWLATPRVTLAAVIVLDQFPRNMYRGTPRAFASDATALRVAEAAVAGNMDKALSTQERQFLYLPFEHVENTALQAKSVALYEALGDARALDYARRHKAIIDRFGRFPHRNAILGRASTPEETEFLKEPGSSF